LADPAIPTATLPADPPKPPDELPPPGACDTHAHMVALEDRFPLASGRVEDPAPGDFETWLGRYRRNLETLGMERGVIVHSILYGTDNAVTAASVAALGRDNFRGIGLVTDEADDATLDGLVADGIVGVRLNYVHGGALSFDGIRAMAPRLAERGLHVQMLINADRHMGELADAVAELPVPVVFDHLAWPDLEAGTGEAGFQQLLRLLAEGRCWVKLTGVYRFCPAPFLGADDWLAALVAANPERCLWGSDWPYIMRGDAAMPDAGELLDAFHRVVTDSGTRRRILVDNPAALYGFEA